MTHRIRQSRWYLKKAARRGLAMAAWASGSLAISRQVVSKSRVRVLTYHRFGDSVFDPFCVRPEDFAAQMRYLAENQLAVSLPQIDAFLAGEADLPDGSVLVTVDDGFRSVLSEMLPILHEYAIPAVAYISPGLINEEEAATAEGPEPYLTWDEVMRLATEGMVIGSHGWSHRSLGRMGPLEVRDEAVRSRETLEQRLGVDVTSLAYPYGTMADFSNTTANILAETGYTTAFTSQHGAITPDVDPIALPRIKVEGGEDLRMFRLLCRGAMDGWRLVDRALWRLQHAGR